MKVDHLSFGKIIIDGQTYREDIVIVDKQIIHREKDASRKWKAKYGHTPLSVEENIPWQCRKLVIGTGMYGALPVMPEVKEKAEKLGVELQIMPSPQAVRHLDDRHTNLILHLTC